LEIDAGEGKGWACAACGVALAPGKVKAAYLGGSFEVELWRCPSCGKALIGEGLARGRMLEVEQALEDK
jgi:predicted RNA-binding Zn-ribbon protein involved in translation (DUF1610 family)